MRNKNTRYYSWCNLEGKRNLTLGYILNENIPLRLEKLCPIPDRRSSSSFHNCLSFREVGSLYYTLDLDNSRTIRKPASSTVSNKNSCSSLMNVSDKLTFPI